MTGLYVHVPFCAKHCHYCDFTIAAGAPPRERGRYLDALAREAAHRAASAAAGFSTLYVGGGTPSRLSEAETRRLFAVLRGSFRFEPGAEITWEANPGDVTPGKADTYRRLGVTRVSVGAQTFDDRLLKSLNRAHDAAAIGRTVGILRGAGFANVNLDLMLALPGQTAAGVRRSLEEALRLGPEHVSLYELTVEEGTVFGERRRRGRLDLPEEETGLEMLTFARAFLKDAGYRHYELLNYARPGFESCHNLLYWSNGDYLGLGPGAFSYLGGRRWRSASSVEVYLRKTEAGDFSAEDDEKLTPEKKRIESLLLALRLTEGAPLGRFAGVLESLKRNVGSLESLGLVERTPDRLKLTDRGQLFAETVFTRLASPD